MPFFLEGGFIIRGGGWQQPLSCLYLLFCSGVFSECELTYFFIFDTPHADPASSCRTRHIFSIVPPASHSPFFSGPTDLPEGSTYAVLSVCRRRPPRGQPAGSPARPLRPRKVVRPPPRGRHWSPRTARGLGFCPDTGLKSVLEHNCLVLLFFFVVIQKTYVHNSTRPNLVIQLIRTTPSGPPLDGRRNPTVRKQLPGETTPAQIAPASGFGVFF